MCQTSLLPQSVKNLPAMQETWVQLLGREDPLEKEWQPTAVFLRGESHGLRNLAGYSPWGGKSQTRLSDFHYYGPGSRLGEHFTLPNFIYSSGGP